MPAIALDHFTSFTSAPSLDDHLDQYRCAGFAVLERTVKHDPGLRTGFVAFGPEYIEFLWVEDESGFAQGLAKEPELEAARAAVRPFMIGMVTDDVGGLHAAWMERDYSLPPVTCRVPRDAPAGLPPVWSFQDIPESVLPGARCFALTYHTRPRGGNRIVRMGPNSIYALRTVVFVSPLPDLRARAWQSLLAPDQAIEEANGTRALTIGPHQVVWMTPDEFRRTYKQEWTPVPQLGSELALLGLFAEDLEQAENVLRGGGRFTSHTQAEPTGQMMLTVSPDPRDGFAFAITENPVSQYLAWRTATTGEQLERSS